VREESKGCCVFNIFSIGESEALFGTLCAAKRSWNGKQKKERGGGSSQKKKINNNQFMTIQTVMQKTKKKAHVLERCKEQRTVNNKLNKLNVMSRRTVASSEPRSPRLRLQVPHLERHY
jgi:hypothetical protein